MSELRIRERFTLRAPPERVWTALLSPERVAACLSGATLEGADDERTFRGSLLIAVGPVTLSYRGTLRFEEIDHGARRVRMSARAREATGSGSATLDMASRVSPDGEGAQVEVEGSVQVTGRIVSFGRGMMERVNQELFRDFTACFAAQLERPPEATAGQSTLGGGTVGATSVTDQARPLDAPRLLWRAVLRWLRELLGRGDRGQP